MIKSLVGPIVNPIVQSIASTPNSGSGLAGALFFLNNMGVVVAQGGSGTLININITPKTFFNNEGDIVDTEAGEIVIEGARRVDHADATDYGYNALGIEYFDTDSGGSPIIPTPMLRHLRGKVNSAYPNGPSDIASYLQTQNMVNESKSPLALGRFDNAARGVATASIAFVESTVGATMVVTDLWSHHCIVRMDDGSVPRVGLSNTDPNLDLVPYIGNIVVDTIESTTLIAEDIYYVVSTMALVNTSATVWLKQHPGNSKKTFEVFSMQSIKGIHLFPTYIHTVSAGTGWNKDRYEIERTGNWSQDFGIVLVRLTVFAPNNLSIGGGLVSLDDNDIGLIYDDAAAPNLKSSSDAAVATVSNAFANGDDIISVVMYNTDDSVKAVGFSKNDGAFTYSSDSTYDGTWSVIGSTIDFFLNYQLDAKVQSIQFRHEGLEGKTLAQMKDWVDANAYTVTAV